MCWCFSLHQDPGGARRHVGWYPGSSESDKKSEPGEIHLWWPGSVSAGPKRPGLSPPHVLILLDTRHRRLNASCNLLFTGWDGPPGFCVSGGGSGCWFDDHQRWRGKTCWTTPHNVASPQILFTYRCSHFSGHRVHPSKLWYRALHVF